MDNLNLGVSCYTAIDNIFGDLNHRLNKSLPIEIVTLDSTE